MKRVTLSILLVLVSGNATLCFAADAAQSRQLTQVSVINALMLGQFNGTVPVQDVLKDGDFGLGTVDQLDGELIILDGKAFQARSDGSVVECAEGLTTPFAVVTPFQGEDGFVCPPIGSLEQLETLLDGRLPSKDAFVAIRIDGHFDHIYLRAVPKQVPPFRTLSEVVKTQSEWERKSIQGTMIGIRSPKWVTGIGIPGYHWHFLSKDQESGGHVFNCQFDSASVAYDRCETWVIKLGSGDETAGLDLNQDLSEELEKVERQRAPTAKE
ncbi:acetolactate decarboxylase [Planctomicrobium sp. SH668]|uniref:acetolactate decarboxylase n=1 Tax=Planctomicrobium sp. SH668 TaxID=3448126 RepID=UPI003F5B582A